MIKGDLNRYRVRSIKQNGSSEIITYKRNPPHRDEGCEEKPLNK